MLAQLSSDLAPRLLELGVAGLMLYWFTQDSSKRLRAVEASVDRQAKANLLSLIATSHLDKSIKDQATALMAEITDKESRNK